MPDCIWSILTAPLIFSKPGLWKVFKKKKKFRSEESPGLTVLTCCAAPAPNGPTVIFQVRVPKQLHLQASFSVPFRRDRIVVAYQIQATDSASCVRLARMVEYQEWNVYKQRREEGEFCLPLHPFFSGVD